MNKKIAIILHNPKGYTGMIGEILLENGYELDIRCPLAGDKIHRPDDYEALVVFGGQMSANDDLPALKDELVFIQEMTEQNKPVLGICLGAQLLAMAFGGSVTRHPEKVVEIGFYPIYPTVEGFLSIFADLPERFFQWHNEGFTLPEGAIKLGASDLFTNQAFKIKSAYGFQFHPEATAEQIDFWHRRCPEELALAGAQTLNFQLIYRDRLIPEIRRWLKRFLLENWLKK